MSKPGSGGVRSETNANVDRRDRLRKLAEETIDLNNDPYFMKNHLGSYECRLCLTLHMNEGSYLAHTQARRHQDNLKRRAKKEKEKEERPQQRVVKQRIRPRKTEKRGTPGYNVIKQFDRKTNQRGLLFRIHYPLIHDGVQPRQKFESPYTANHKNEELKKDKSYMNVYFASEPYETIVFRVPNDPVDKHRVLLDWDKEKFNFTFQFFYTPMKAQAASQPPEEEMRR